MKENPSQHFESNLGPDLPSHVQESQEEKTKLHQELVSAAESGNYTEVIELAKRLSSFDQDRMWEKRRGEKEEKERSEFIHNFRMQIARASVAFAGNAGIMEKIKHVNLTLQSDSPRKQEALKNSVRSLIESLGQADFSSDNAAYMARMQMIPALENLREKMDHFKTDEIPWHSLAA